VCLYCDARAVPSDGAFAACSQILFTLIASLLFTVFVSFHYILMVIGSAARSVLSVAVVCLKLCDCPAGWTGVCADHVHGPRPVRYVDYHGTPRSVTV